MATTKRTSYLTVGTITPQGSSLYLEPYFDLIRFRQDNAARRIQPLGIEKLFNGTGVSAYVYRSKAAIQTINNSNTTNYFLYEAGLHTNDVPLTGPTSDWVDQLRIKLKDQSINLGQAFAERKQVEKMFVDFSRRLIGAYRSLRKGRPQDVYSHLSGGKLLPKGWKKGFKPDVIRTASDNWLAWQYGVRPLVQDISGAITEYYKVRGVKPLIRRVVVNPPKKGFAKVSTSGSGQNWDTTSTRVVLTGHIECYAEFDSGSSAWDQTANRLGLTDPVVLLWEVMPYSFVIDWFLNVGEFLQAQGSITGLKRVGIHATWRRSELRSSQRQGGGEALITQQYVTRQFFSTLPGAALRFGSGIRSWQRQASALALIRAPLAAFFSKR